MNADEKAQRLRYGGPRRVLLVLSPPALLLRTAEVVKSTEGAILAGSFSNATDAIDWAVWEREPWHLAYIDLSLPEGPDDLVKLLVNSPRAGTVIGITDHLWREVRQRAAAMGIADILEKGDPVAFRGDLESRVS